MQPCQQASMSLSALYGYSDIKYQSLQYRSPISICASYTKSHYSDPLWLSLREVSIRSWGSVSLSFGDHFLNSGLLPKHFSITSRAGIGWSVQTCWWIVWRSFVLQHGNVLRCSRKNCQEELNSVTDASAGKFCIPSTVFNRCMLTPGPFESTGRCFFTILGHLWCDDVVFLLQKSPNYTLQADILWYVARSFVCLLKADSWKLTKEAKVSLEGHDRRCGSRLKRNVIRFVSCIVYIYMYVYMIYMCILYTICVYTMCATCVCVCVCTKNQSRVGSTSLQLGCPGQWTRKWRLQVMHPTNRKWLHFRRSPPGESTVRPIQLNRNSIMNAPSPNMSQL